MYKKPCAACKNSHSTRMSTSWEYGDVSLARYQNPGRKRKSGSAKSSNPAGKKKKEKEKETLTIQNMTPVELKKNEVTCLGEMPSDNDLAAGVEMMKKECHDYVPNPNNPHCREDMVEVVQEGMSYPQPSEEETHEAVQELMNELCVMDQIRQTYPPQPPPEDDNEGFKRLVRMATIFQSPAFQSPDSLRHPRARSVDYMVCPCHEVRLEERKSQNGGEYVKCPRYPCLLFCAKEKVLDYMREVYRQPHPDVCDMWSCLLCFCREPATLQLHSSDNPSRLFLTCSKKKCNFFRWADKRLGQNYRKSLFNKEKKPQHPLPTRDADGYPLRGYDIPDSLPPSPRVRHKEDVQRERPLTNYENQLLRQIQQLKNRQEVLVAPAPPPPKYSDSVQNWQKGQETVAYHFRTGLPSDGLF